MERRRGEGGNEGRGGKMGASEGGRRDKAQLLLKAMKKVTSLQSLQGLKD